MRSTPCQVWSSGERQQHCEELSLKGAPVMTCPHCVASSGAEPCHCDAAFRLGLRVPPMQGRGGSQAPGHSCHTVAPGSYWASDRSGVGGHKGESNRPLAPWHPPPCRPGIPCSRGMIICMTEPGAFAASDYDSPWQQAFFSSLSHAPVNLMTVSPAQLQERVCGCIS